MKCYFLCLLLGEEEEDDEEEEEEEEEDVGLDYLQKENLEVWKQNMLVVQCKRSLVFCEDQ